MGNNLNNFFSKNIFGGLGDIDQNFLNELFPKPVKDKYELLGWEKIGNGYYLKPIEDIDKQHYKDFGYLCKEDTQLSNEVFRVGGLGCKGFKSGYANLLWYDRTNKSSDGNFPSGLQCIVNGLGEIILKSSSICTSLYLLEGCIATMNNKYYNLITGEVVAKGYSTIKSKEYLFVESSEDKQLDIRRGVYQIRWRDGDRIIFE